MSEPGVPQQPSIQRFRWATRLQLQTIAGLVLVACMVETNVSWAPQAIDPVDFRPFVDGKNWIVRQPLKYVIGVSSESVTVPVGFVTDLASIPPALQSIIQQNGRYLLPAVVHDYLYWKQTCTQEQSDQILLLAMIENEVSEFHQLAIYNAVRAAGSFAWDDNREEREAHLIRIIPSDHQAIPRNTLWSGYREQLMRDGVVDGPNGTITTKFCARGDMSVNKALHTL